MPLSHYFKIAWNLEFKYLCTWECSFIDWYCISTNWNVSFNNDVKRRGQKKRVSNSNSSNGSTTHKCTYVEFPIHIFIELIFSLSLSLSRGFIIYPHSIKNALPNEINNNNGNKMNKNKNIENIQITEKKKKNSITTESNEIMVSFVLLLAIAVVLRKLIRMQILGNSHFVCEYMCWNGLCRFQIVCESRRIENFFKKKKSAT